MGRKGAGLGRPPLHGRGKNAGETPAVQKSAGLKTGHYMGVRNSE